MGSTAAAAATTYLQEGLGESERMDMPQWVLVMWVGEA